MLLFLNDWFRYDLKVNNMKLFSEKKKKKKKVREVIHYPTAYDTYTESFYFFFFFCLLKFKKLRHFYFQWETKYRLWLLDATESV